MISKEQSNSIKLVALIAMSIDHIGAFLFPVEIFKIIGRIAFPLFAYQLTIGYQKTSSLARYIKRLLFFGLIAQIPYYLLNEKFVLNILFSLAAGIACIYLIENKKLLFLIPILLASYFIEYQIYGLTVILIFYFIKNNHYKAGLFSLITLGYSVGFNRFIQLFSVLSLPLILKPLFEIKISNKLFYLFYPAHLFVILFIRILFF